MSTPNPETPTDAKYDRQLFESDPETVQERPDWWEAEASENSMGA